MAKDIEKFKERLMTLVNCIDATNKKYAIQQMGGEFKTKYSVKMAVDLMKEIIKMYEEELNEYTR